MISLNIFSKCPFNGNPKTRLKGFLTKDERSFLTRKMLTNILDETSGLGRNVETTLWIYPHFKHDWFNELKIKYKINIKKQEGISLCERMNNCLSSESLIYDQTVLVGSDIPCLTRNIIIDAINVLSKKDIVIGPSKDGGFYLIGTNNFFENLIDCSKPMNTENILNNINSHYEEIGFTRELKDIDNPEDLLII